MEEDDNDNDDDDDDEDDDLDVPWRMVRRFSTFIESENAMDGKEGGGIKSPPGILALTVSVCD